jgi:hypothetical protein
MLLIQANISVRTPQINKALTAKAKVDQNPKSERAANEEAKIMANVFRRKKGEQYRGFLKKLASSKALPLIGG